MPTLCPLLIFSFGMNVILNYSDYLKILKNHLWTLYEFLWKRCSFWHFSECSIIKCEIATAFIRCFIVNNKRPTITARKFCKQALIHFTDSWSSVQTMWQFQLTKDRKITGGGYLVLNPSIKRYIDTQNLSIEVTSLMKLKDFFFLQKNSSYCKLMMNKYIVPE